MKRKLLVLDIDGTLTNSKKEITKETRETILKMMEAGHACALASGRPTPGLTFIAEQLNFDVHGGYLLSYNGARVSNFKTGEIVFEQKLDNKYVMELYNYAEQNDCGILTYNETEILSGREVNDYVKYEANLLRLPIVQTDFAGIDFPVNKCLMTAEPDKAKACCEELVEKYQGELAVCRSEPFYIEIVPTGVDKAASLEKILPILGFEREDCICCGDGYNDISMVKFAGTGVAMANAVQELKDIADFQTLSNEEDGVAYAIKKLIL